ncbi:hypothetical protein EGM51_11140 [Verrucomicrobia bacterium S94]|nr:hypothetical protein EGM51_11140 [Verrucomicrobia bacterium S94]
MAEANPPTVCEVCGEPLPGRYWNYEGHACCSQQCVDVLRPKCAKCGRPISGQYIEADGKIYCSQKCFNSTLPRCEICGVHIESGYSITRHNYCDECLKNSPTCFSCGLPAKNPTELSDGRIVCSICRSASADTIDVALKHYDLARRELESWCGLQMQTVPQLKLVDRDDMGELSGTLRKTDEPVTIRGLYSRQTMLVKRGLFGSWRKDEGQSNESIYILDHLHEEVFRVAAIHELMHDLVHEHFPKLENAPLWVHEGISQFAAAEYCRKRNYLDALDTIETSKDPDYGDGYRYFNALAGSGGWPALRHWIEKVEVSGLPPQAPLPAAQ